MKRLLIEVWELVFILALIALIPLGIWAVWAGESQALLLKIVYTDIIFLAVSYVALYVIADEDDDGKYDHNVGE